MGRMWSLQSARTSARTSAHTSSRRVAGAVLAGGLALGALSACGSEDPEPTGASDDAGSEPAGASGSPSEAGTASPDASGSPSSSPSATATATTAVPVYFVGDTPRGQRLYREFRPVPQDDPLAAAADLVTDGDAVDPDYTTLWPGGTFAEVSGGDGPISVVLPDRSWTQRPDGMSRQQARLAVQQLVWTLQGVSQSRDRLLAYVDDGGGGGGDPVPLLGVPTADGVRNAPPLDVLALVNVTTPEERTTVSGRFTASGVASSFEGTVPWEVRRGGAGGEVVLEGFATAEGYLDRLYPWETEVDVSSLAPGAYTFVAATSDPGGEGPGPTEDTRSIVVE